MRFVSLLLVIMTLNLPLAAQECDTQKQFANLDVRISHSRIRGCNISADQSFDKQKTQNERNRSWTFFADGLIMIFVGTNDYDRMSQATGSRCLQIFGRFREAPAFTETKDGVRLTLPTGRNALFSRETGDIVSLDGFDVQLTPLEHFDQMAKKEGGVAIKPRAGSLLIDYGWRTGEMSISQLWRPAVVLDGAGFKCTLKIGDFFSQDPEDADEVIFKHASDDALYTFLKSRCPGIAPPEKHQPVHR